MAFINFEKGTGRKYLTSKEIDEAIEKRKEQHKKEVSQANRHNAASSYSNEKQWILPGLCDNLSESVKIKKKKKSRHNSYSSSSSNDSGEHETKKKSGKRTKDKSRKGKKRSKRSSSSESDSNINLDSSGRHKSKPKKKKKCKKRRRSASTSTESEDEKSDSKSLVQNRDEWMELDALIPTYERKQQKKPEKEATSITAAPGQSDRELNPYWKDGGAGLPSVDKDYDLKTSVGDKGLEWYEKALQRAQETAIDEGRSLADVVTERWGSLETLTGLITRAKAEKSSRLKFKKPGEEFGRSYSSCRGDRDRKWMKSTHKDVKQYDQRSGDKLERHYSSSRSDRDRECTKNTVRDVKKHDHEHAEERQGTSKEDEVPNKKSTLSIGEPAALTDENPAQILNDDEMNALAAKLVKAEILGKTEQVQKLKQALEAARKAREAAVDAAGADAAASDETVVLIQTNTEGLTRPYVRPAHPEPSKGRRKKKNAETHRDGQRVRYFPDDDNRDLKQMFESEKYGTHEDEQALFLKMAKRRAGAGSDEEDAAFADAARIAESDGKVQQRERDRAVKETQESHRRLDSCLWCFGNKKQSKNLLVALGKKSYLCLPESPLTPYHCLLVPFEHSVSGTRLDEDVWEEMHNFRKSLIAMAKASDKYAIFFEDARGLKKLPHMIYQCIILDKKDGELAPIYFKKALLDCEGEWTTNKKIADIKGSDVRGTIPKGLPYFSVEFPPEGGFAHVIENENLFPANFAQSVIGGMLDLDHRLWRHPKKSNSSAQSQRERTIEFSRKFARYDFTKNNASSSSSPTSSSSSDSD